MPRRIRLLTCVGFVLALSACDASKNRDPEWGGIIDPPQHGSDPGSHASKEKLYTLKVGEVPVHVRLALTNEQRHQGLAGVSSLEASHGMLFVYRHVGLRNFWMKGCLIRLDIAYIDGDGRIFQIETLEPPRPGTPDGLIPHSPSLEACSLVLEMPGGFFAGAGLARGARVTIPRSVPTEKAE